MEKKSRIEFRKGEKYCRFDGILLNEENCEKLYGFPGEVEIFDDNMIVIDDTVYTDKNFNEVIKMLGEVHEGAEEYDEILSQGFGFSKYCKDKELENKIVISIESIEHIKKFKPYMKLYEDYPKFNLEKYNEVYNELDKYYQNLHHE